MRYFIAHISKLVVSGGHSADKKDMTKEIFFIATSFFLALTLSSQTDSLNKFNSKGKKTGWWTVFLNDKIDPTNKKEDAYYLGYELWDNGEPVFKYYKHRLNKNKMTTDAKPEKGNPQLLSGTFKWYTKEGILMLDETYKDGSPVFFNIYDYTKSFSNSTSNVIAEVDYTKKYNGITGTHFYREFFRKGKTIQYWYRKDKKGWFEYKID